MEKLHLNVIIISGTLPRYFIFLRSFILHTSRVVAWDGLLVLFDSVILILVSFVSLVHSIANFILNPHKLNHRVAC